MRDTLTLIAIIIGTLSLALLTSLLLGIDWVRSHWVREALVLLFILLELIFGGLMLIEKIKNIQDDDKEHI